MSIFLYVLYKDKSYNYLETRVLRLVTDNSSFLLRMRDGVSDSSVCGISGDGIKR